MMEAEELTPYRREDLDGDGEFKIVGSPLQAFRKPETLQRLIEEEGRSGWIMVEKFDDARVRFKRRRGQHGVTRHGGIDPYRTTYGIGQAGLARLIVAINGIVCIIAALLALV